MRHTRIIVTHYGGPDALRVVEEESPAPKNREVRVRVLAAGVALPDISPDGVLYENVKGFIPKRPGYLSLRVGIWLVQWIGSATMSMESNLARWLLRCRSTAPMRSLCACRNANWSRCRLDWTLPRP